MDHFNFPRCAQCGGKLHEFGKALKCGDCGLPAGKTDEVEELHRRREAEPAAAEAQRLQERSQQLAAEMAGLGKIAERQTAPEEAPPPPPPAVPLPAPDLGPSDQPGCEAIAPVPAPAQAERQHRRGKRE
jgi:hypothetical protein